MQKALHGISTHYCNILTDARIARDTGYDSLELLSAKLVRYLDNGGTTQKLKQVADGYGLSVGCVNALLEIERHKGDEKKAMLAEATRLTRAAAELNCPTVQILALNGIDDQPDDTVMDIITENVGAIARIGEEYGVRYQIEVIAFTKFRTLQQGLEVIRRVGKKNVGMVIDFWHLYAAGNTPEEVAKLDKDLIYGVHFCDGRLPKPGEAWDQMVLRNYMPGEGELDIQAWVDAVKATGYDGMWSAELFSPNRWEYDLYDIATECRENMEKYLGK
ncbi:sugar phosphate isomerase/epimerase [Yokenella regensburgei]|uniref:sugar phosphate isomerase/epimerase family protein n=1 Tax=Yokenella regensburgei TaxID=158877 RepID=UPI003F18EC3D